MRFFGGILEEIFQPRELPFAGRIEAAQHLRGVASLMVCWFHLASVSNLNTGFWKHTAEFGHVGVQIFFVISGFILPFSLWRSQYEIQDYWRFLLRRLARLEPPYLVSIGITLLAGLVASNWPGYRGQPFQLNWASVLLHLGYLNNFFGLAWLQPVYWTLGIELQFYCLLAVAYPLVRRAKEIWFLLSGLALLGLQMFLAGDRGLIVSHFSWFLIGVAVFRFRLGGLSRVGLVLLTFGAFLVMARQSTLLAAGAGIAAGVLLLFNGPRNWVGETLGNLSYSLYLVHMPIGGKLANLLSRYAEGPIWGLGAGLASLAASLLAAQMLYRFVEAPAMVLAGSIRYGARERSPKSSCEATGIAASKS